MGNVTGTIAFPKNITEHKIVFEVSIKYLRMREADSKSKLAMQVKHESKL